MIFGFDFFLSIILNQALHPSKNATGRGNVPTQGHICIFLKKVRTFVAINKISMILEIFHIMVIMIYNTFTISLE